MDTKRILLVEDEPQLQDMYKRKLEHEGYIIDVAGTGKQALQLLEQQQYNIILLDVMLPDGMNGFDILESIKKDDTLKNIPVIMMTNVSGEADTARSIGAADYLIKADTALEDVINKIKSFI